MGKTMNGQLNTPSPIMNRGQAQWNAFITEITKGNVIPVIGPDILCEDENGQLENPHQVILKYFIEALGADPQKIKSFSELIDDFPREFGNGEIYEYINNFASQYSFMPSKLLIDLVSIKKFPFIMTTSFTPVVEDAMREVWGDKLQVMCFKNDPSENQDIKSERNLLLPTVYYMFGRVGEYEAHRYVVTDIDMLDFCSSWVADTGRRPSRLTGCLKNKYLLMLGNCYSDWLFRFIWYSLRKSDSKTISGLYSYVKEDDELSRFLARNQTILRENPGQVIENMRTSLQDRNMLNKPIDKFATVENYADFFISYSRTDAKFAKALYDELTRRGKEVWYDRDNITAGGKFMEEIVQGIRTASYFIPILTANIEKEKGQSHVYRTEWDEAIQMSITYGRTYLIPVCQSGFDFYRANIPDRMRQHNAVEFNDENDVKAVVDKILNDIEKNKK